MEFLILPFLTSPLEQFEVIPYISIQIFDNQIFNLTNFIFYIIFNIILLIILHIFSLNQKQLIPNRWSILLESLYTSIHIIVKEQISPSIEKFFPFIYSLFIFLLISNLIGNIPFSFAITTSAILTIGLSFIIFYGVTLLSIYKNKIKFFSFFVPQGTPLFIVPFLVIIELISYIARAFSLGVRLFSNLVAGHTLLGILSSFLYPIIIINMFIFIISIIPLSIFIALIGLEIAVSFIQSYVFSILVSIYLKDAIFLH